MKKAFALIMVCIMPLFLFACKAEKDSGVPVIQTSFDQTAKVMLNKETYPCRISRSDTADLVIEMLEGAPNAGVVYACSANNTMITLDNMTFTLEPQEVQRDALIFTLTSLFNAMTRIDGLEVSRLEQGGFQYKGNCKAGAFTVVQRIDYTYDNIQVGNYKIQFD